MIKKMSLCKLVLMVWFTVKQYCQLWNVLTEKISIVLAEFHMWIELYHMSLDDENLNEKYVIYRNELLDITYTYIHYLFHNSLIW